ncbi:helix-turn-helix transcriptional regulator [Nocardioides hwasunensis]|uniref:Response regulator transcription factor n=1 Tax=Nocardioides hwasunensis TaxID=397258 RepID=A0ABR8MF99_9ACTN|nr:response regulator transcription factor [Nocardioides hwasunensis]MBD3914772.1 response regulator transcription factor [Nocardioides hwasunensis]
MTIRIALINHDEVVVLGVATMMARHARDISLTDLRGDFEETVDLVLLDPAGMSDEPKLLAQLLADRRVRHVVALTGDFEPMAADAFFARGYDGYLSTGLSTHELIDSLRAVCDGLRVLAPVPDDDRITEKGWPGREHGLTEREADVLSLIAGGLSNKEIAEQLGITVNSVKSYIRGAYRTIDVDSRTKAVLWSITHGLRTPTVAHGARSGEAGTRAG